MAAVLILSVKYLEIGKRMLNKRERESERVRFQGDNHNLALEGRRGGGGYKIPASECLGFQYYINNEK